MPTNRRRRRPLRRGLHQLDTVQRVWLESGFRFLDLETLSEAEALDLARTLWRLHGKQLLADFIEAHPGRRPWSWWTFDAPAELRSAWQREQAGGDDDGTLEFSFLAQRGTLSRDEIARCRSLQEKAHEKCS